ncbi:hypothetical protein [Anabaena sp. UHCC 0451]|uniref:hypothetical protein n=1 Tax=Anabaena sp. UHCC 0451 TaxID=2055235 RepID=UPI002B204E5D|nr:hypothetical protein [Anabaena sp. UHCC 0451]MEA5577724.1 hypothetical protein [Anabaena sp. UHCC 0451]
MSDSSKLQAVSCQSICEECAFYVKLECTHPDEFEINCAVVNFCNSFTPAVEVDSSCVSFGNDDL